MRNNKGFSFVEIVIVVAIMAIASAILAPQLMKYVEKSRLSTDAQVCSTIKTCVNTAMKNDEIWYDSSYWGAGKFKIYIRLSDDGSKMLIKGLKDGEDTAEELRKLIANLNNPKQSGMNSYLVEVEAVEKVKDGKTTRSIGHIHVETSDYHFENNSDTPIY